ncbi:Uu.00g091950.m01.CDS01 [Anthostomella pinea]|uniref:Uu.00g091950.m01.CDS01 n=1 Tax=Anthostomella pinea TaxID=933095 RepID=A0AAI8YI08_9PEZI|nr:Uu.00g091950.m01.CDS01 [Anthostomella pinea]
MTKSTIASINSSTVTTSFNTTTRARLSTSTRQLSKTQHGSSQHGSDPSKPQSPDDPLPSFSFDGLGMSRNVKIVVIVVLSIFGTMETVFWAKAIWRWWNKEEEEEDDDESQSQV